MTSACFTPAHLTPLHSRNLPGAQLLDLASKWKKEIARKCILSPLSFGFSLDKGSILPNLLSFSAKKCTTGKADFFTRVERRNFSTCKSWVPQSPNSRTPGVFFVALVLRPCLSIWAQSAFLNCALLLFARFHDLVCLCRAKPQARLEQAALKAQDFQVGLRDQGLNSATCRLQTPDPAVVFGSCCIPTPSIRTEFTGFSLRIDQHSHQQTVPTYFQLVTPVILRIDNCYFFCFL